MYWKDYFFLKLFIDLHDFIADLYICITVKFLLLYHFNNTIYASS